MNTQIDLSDLVSHVNSECRLFAKEMGEILWFWSKIFAVLALAVWFQNRYGDGVLTHFALWGFLLYLWIVVRRERRDRSKHNG